MNTSDYNMELLSNRGQKILVVLFLLCCTTTSFSQPSDEIPVITTEGKYTEELYVRTDRDVYIVGESVYLKVFCYSNLTHNNSGISDIAYVSLLDRSNNPLLQVKIRINGLSGSGYFTLPDSLSTGNYYIATCTHWMRNFSPELYSYKNISVINPFRNIDRIKMRGQDNDADTVIFYPEGGNIITGAETAIGFRCLGTKMNPVEIKGVITDSGNNIICNVQSDEDGFGLFRVRLPANTKLYLKPDEGALTSKGFELPSAYDSGIALSVTEDEEQGIFRVRVTVSHDFDTGNKKFRLVYAPVSLKPLVLDTKPLTGGEKTFARNSLPAGLASVILTDESGTSYSERWVYNEQKQAINFIIKPDKETYSSREKVSIDITSVDALGKPVKSDLLISAVNLITMTDRENIHAADLQITGLPEINDKNGICSVNDRLIFLHNATGLYTGNNGQQAKVYLPEPDGHLISGVIRNTVSGKPLSKENIVLAFVGKAALCSFATTDEEGRFIFVILETGVREIVIQPLSPDLDDYYIELDNPFPETFSRAHPPLFSLDTGMLKLINKAVISMQIKMIYDPLMPEKPGVLNMTIPKDFYGLPDHTTRMSTFIQLTSLREAIKEIVPGAVTTSRKGKTVINTVYKQNYQIETRDPLVIVDGVPVLDHEKVLNIKGDKIEKIDVLSKKYYVSDIELGGIIDITSYDGDLSVIEFDKPVFRQEFEAPQPGYGFASPDYSEASRKESRIPDYRNTLYWNPDIRTDENGRAAVEFYTSDEAGDYIMLVEGFTSDGRRGSATLLFSVK